MENIYHNLQNLLKSGEGYLDAEGRLNRTLILNKAYDGDGDGDLLDLLLGNPQMHKQFFTQTAKALIFKRDDFIEFIAHKNFLADSYTDYKNKIGLGDGKKYLKASNDTVLMFPFKDCVLEGGMSNEEEGKREIFYNEILAADEIDRLKAPKLLTNIKRITAAGESQATGFTRNENGRIIDNLLIKGNNFCALHSLKAEFENCVKLIYIDPPYNTGNDSFKYNDRFNHSTWLTFMKNRLEVARELLRDDGVIFVQCDDNEQAYLKVLMDEVFGRENFITNITWQRTPEGRTALGQGSSFINNSSEYILSFCKSSINKPKDSNIQKKVDATEKALNQYSYYLKSEGNRKLDKVITDSKGNKIELYKHDNYLLERIPSKTPVKDRLDNFEKLVRIAAQQEESSLQQKILSNLDEETLYSVEYIPTLGKQKGRFKKAFYIKNGILLFLENYAFTDGKRVFRNADMNNFWSHDEIQVTGIADEGKVKLKRGKKPEALLERILQLATQQGDIVLDFFAGSGTTAAVAHKMGRQYIAVEQMDYIETITKARLKKVIGVKTESDLMGDKYDYDTGGISKNVNWQGGGEFIYAELAPLNQTLIDAIDKADNLDIILKIREKILQSHFTQYQLDHEAAHDDQAFVGLDLNEQKQILISMLDKNQLYVNYSERTDSLFKCSQEDIKLSEDFYKGEK